MNFYTKIELQKPVKKVKKPEASYALKLQIHLFHKTFKIKIKSEYKRQKELKIWINMETQRTRNAQPGRYSM